jgi:hypothetical protein
VSLLYLVLVLVLVGVLLHCLNAYGSEYIDGKFIRLINVVVIIAAIVYVLAAFGLFAAIDDVRVPRVG